MTQQQFDQYVYVSHPLEKIRLNQKVFLESSQQFDFDRLMLNYGNASHRYAEMASGQITTEDYEHWLEGLDERIADSFRKAGFEANKKSLALRRHTLERRDIGMEAFMSSLLRPEDLAAWQDLKTG